MLKFKTDGQELFYLDGGDVIVGDTIRYLEAEFDLSDDWKSFPEVTAYFKCGAAINSIILAGGKIKAEDNLALAPGVWSVYLRAYELEGEEIKRQITSSTAKINVLSHGKFTGREFVPENADAYEKRMTEMKNYLVFEEYNPSEKYVKGNKVSYEGSSYVLTADSAMGTNPTDSEAWLLIAERGDDGTRIFEFPFKDYGAEVGRIYEIGSLGGLEDFYGQTIPGIDSWRVGDYFLSEDGKMLIIEGMVKQYGVVRFITVRCLADIKGKDGKNGEKGTTIHTVENFGFGKTTPIGMYFVNDKKGVSSGVIYKNFTMPEGFVSGDLLFDGKNGLMFDHDYREYSYTKDDVTYFETYDAIWCIANLNGTVPEGKYANIDLSNVSDEDFRAKAEEAGVGGDAGLTEEKCIMEFMGVVTELPETANEGEVYKQAGGLQLGDYIGYAWEMNEPEEFWIHPDRIDTFNWQATENMNTAWYQSENEEKPILFVFELMTNDGRTLHYTIEAEEFSMEGEASCIMYGQTSVTESETLFGGIVSIRKGTLTEGKTCVYHNGEWVEL